MSGPVSRDASRRARAYLLRVAEPPCPALVEFIAEVGPVRAAERVREGSVPGPVADETSARRHLDLADADLAAGAAVGARLVTPEDDEWPAWPFTALANATARGLRGGVPPLALWVRGPRSLNELAENAVAVVGSRAASGYGQHVATEFGHGLAAAGVTVVSGAAYGVDGAAHRGAVAAEGPTVAVLACGADLAYPAGHSGLLDRIVEHGAVASEYPPGTTPARYRFLVRNRLIAALGGGTVVVEAGARSGAKSTAAVSRALGRVLMAVPGPITSATSVGCHELLRSGEAVAVSSVDEIIESTGRLGADLVDPGSPETRATDGLDGDAARVYDALATGTGHSAERIAVDAGVPLARVRAILPTLELGGLAFRCTAGWRRARAPTPHGER
jgi:DNA processing protein